VSEGETTVPTVPSAATKGFQLKQPQRQRAATATAPPTSDKGAAASESIPAAAAGRAEAPKIPAPSTAAPATAAPSTVAPSKLATSEVRPTYDAASNEIIKLMCLAALQLLSLASAVPKWSGVWLVLEAGDGSAAAPFYGKVIKCAGGQTSASGNSEFCKDWWAFRGGKQGRERRQQVDAASAEGSGRGGRGQLGGAQDGGAFGGDDADGGDPADDDGPKGDSGKSSSGDGSSSGSRSYPSNTLHERATIKAAVKGGLGKKELADVDLKNVLFIGRIESVNEITTVDLANMFSRAGGILRERCKGTNGFTWARACPLDLLSNEWTSSAFKRPVNGAHFLSLNNAGGKGQTMDEKRLAWCVAAHLSPFFAKVFEETMAAAHRSGRKRRARQKDPFEDAKQLNTKKKPRPPMPAHKNVRGKDKAKRPARSKAQIIVAAAELRVKEAEANANLAKSDAAAAAASKAKDAAKAADAAQKPKHSPPSKLGGIPPPGASPPGTTGSGAAGAPRAAAPPGASSSGAACVGAAGSGGDGPIPIVAQDSLWALERASLTLRMHQMWMRRPAPLLPPSTVVSVVPLSGPDLATATRASTRVRVVLPRALLKEAFAALTAAEESACRTSEDGPDQPQMVVQLTLAKFDPVYLFQSSLMEMSSVLAFNESILSSTLFVSWMGRLASSGAQLPAMLNFWSGAPSPISSMAESVCSGISVRLPGDCVWALPRGGLRSSPSEVQVGAFGGYSVCVLDIFVAGQEAFMTNAPLDAGLAELQERCMALSIPTAVLSTSQSASFTHIGKIQVQFERALAAIVEVLDSWSPSTTRFVMVLNMDNVHWISASVSLLSGTVTVYDSLAGGSSAAKDHIVNRLLLFARQAELRWRLSCLNLSSVGGAEWTVDHVNSPGQEDGYNCGLYAFSYIWCTVYEQDWGSVVVSGDQLRLSLIYFVLMCGHARQQSPRVA